VKTGIVRLASILAIALALVACEQAQTSVADKAGDKAVVAEALIGKLRPAFELIDTDDKMRSVDEWNGKVLVVNFWATWCPPCRKEMPAFIELQEKYGKDGLQFVGIAIDEKDKVVDFSDTYGVNYPMLLGTLDAIELGKQFGNRFGALPYTVIIARDGKIAFTIRGELEKHTAEAEIKKLL
jgi:thiol-disulfide isomerase/thioredoxin